MRPPKPPLNKRLRKAGNTKRGYSVLVDLDGNPAHFDALDNESVWKKVKRKQRDLDNNTLLLTFDDDTELRMSDMGALVTCRFATEDPETEETL